MKLNYKKIKSLREKHYWSQDELASISGLSIRTIQRVEKTGNSSLETMKALASVFKVDPLSLNNQAPIQNVTFSFISKFGWILFLSFAIILLGAWVIDIVIPTLKGANFNNQYEIHGNFRYLDFATMSFVIGFIWLSINVTVDYFRKKRICKRDLKQWLLYTVLHSNHLYLKL